MKSPCNIFFNCDLSLSLLFNLAHSYTFSHHLGFCKFFQSTGSAPLEVPSILSELLRYLLADLYPRISLSVPKQPIASPGWDLHCHRLHRQSLWRADPPRCTTGGLRVRSCWLINACVFTSPPPLCSSLPTVKGDKRNQRVKQESSKTLLLVFTSIMADSFYVLHCR